MLTFLHSTGSCGGQQHTQEALLPQYQALPGACAGRSLPVPADMGCTQKCPAPSRNVPYAAVPNTKARCRVQSGVSQVLSIPLWSNPVSSASQHALMPAKHHCHVHLLYAMRVLCNGCLVYTSPSLHTRGLARVRKDGAKLGFFLGKV
jgi:hypothetical protein